jgi:hypothetical protein
MSATATDRDLEMLAWLAERDMAAVAHAHGQFLAATEPDAVASLGRTYQRVSRCLRTTLALKMKAAQAQASQAAWTKVGARRDENLREAAIEARTLDLQDALERVANAAIPDPREREDRLADFDLELDDWIEADDFLTADLDEQVLRACRLMELPEDLAPAWRTLPRPTVFPEDLPQDDDAEADAVADRPTARPADTS